MRVVRPTASGRPSSVTSTVVRAASHASLRTVAAGMGQAPGEVASGLAGEAGERAHRCGHRQVGALAADLRERPAVELAVAEFHQRVGPPLRGAPLLVGEGSAQGVEGGLQGCSALRVEQAIENEESIQGGAEVQMAPVIGCVGVGQRPVGIGAVAQVAGDQAEASGVEGAGGLEERRFDFPDRVGADLPRGAGA